MRDALWFSALLAVALGCGLAVSRWAVVGAGFVALGVSMIVIVELLHLPGRRAESRRRRRRCVTCGYDLRATPERCPECGTPAAR